jgi:diguanylate cyclase (GGDEF)-like protein
MPQFLISEPPEGILAALGQSLDLVDFGIVLLNRELRTRFINQCFAAMWQVPQPLLDAGPTFRDLLEHGARSGWYMVAPEDMTGYLDAREDAVRAGPIDPAEIDLSDGRRLLFRCIVSPDGGRILTYADITRLAEEREMLHRAREAAERIGLELRVSNESLENQALYLSSLADAAEAAARRAEDAKRQLEREISERRELEGQLRRLATTDSLTGALNRGQTISLGQREMDRTQKLRQTLAVMMLDIDHFKSINDRYGHRAGDAVLQQFAGIIASGIRRIDLFGRVGGEEFAVVLPAITPGAALLAAERIRSTVAGKPVLSDGTSISVTVSIGLAMAEAGDASIEQIIARADSALYTAKGSGRNAVISVGAAFGADGR